ncbi:DUF7547 family protein [Halorhabdus amylolytica]|uniref:DUF7547 family protein n=1 Tax=Halorhabdus amylolytica TaxID=2559573 RepID=UPI0020C00C0F|nr:hypothetical protein [Halorhabdus amylolytica]
MSSDSVRPTPAEIVGELTRTLRALRRELREANGRGGRRLDRLVQFTSEVTIPATILVLETNIRALGLLQRTLRLARDAEAEEGSQSAELSSVGHSVVDRIDEALREAQSTVEKTSTDEKARELLDEARELNRQLAARLDADDAGNRLDADDAGATASVDVESELASLKDQYDDTGDSEADADDGPDGD